MTADLPLNPDVDPASRSILFNTYQRARLLLSLAAVIAFILFWYLGHWFHIPFDLNYDDSLLLQPSAAMAYLIVIVGLGLSVVVGTVIAGPIRYDAGLCTAGLGLLALSVRGGPVRYILFAHPGPETYLSLFAELILLFLLFVAMTFFQKFFHTFGWLREDTLRADGLPDMEHSLTEKLQAAAVQIVVTGILMYFLSATDRKFQVIAGADRRRVLFWYGHRALDLSGAAQCLVLGGAIRRRRGWISMGVVSRGRLSDRDSRQCSSSRVAARLRQCRTSGVHHRILDEPARWRRTIRRTPANFQVFKMKVTGPSFTSETFISAANFPVCTGTPVA